MIGEIRDFETLDIAVKAALTGHLVLSSLHTTTAAGSIIRMMNMGVEPFLICSSVLAIVAQRLLRKLCPHCKEVYTVSKELAKKFSLEANEIYGVEWTNQFGFHGLKWTDISNWLKEHPEYKMENPLDSWALGVKEKFKTSARLIK